MSEDVTVQPPPPKAPVSQPPPPPEGATASLVLGILSLFIPFIGLVLGIIAIVLGNKARKQPNGGLGTAGFVLGILGTVLGSIWIIYIIILLGAIATVIKSGAGA